MDIGEWWSTLDSLTHELLIAHNGDVVSADILRQSTPTGEVIALDAKWIGESDVNGFYLSDEATDWIEATANGERPEP
ncbi:hypothetical protein [Cryobacterium arcticum]|uniref:hypothetical protein n=1 Tax=Cryobacterium arcticum TaxID=670052 RepID=UPI0011B6BF31|nr:hypothetical protein [Cryobacterium arcticum]